MRVAYADPPYIGCAKKYPEKKEVDHADLVNSLCSNYEAWALSLHTPSLPEILTYCPKDVRIGAWVKPFCSFKPGVGQAYAWEPIIFYGIRKRTRNQPTVRDWVMANITLERGLTGAKPMKFCFWLFDFMNLDREDELHDLFPGTGIVTRAWEIWKTTVRNEQEVMFA